MRKENVVVGLMDTVKSAELKDVAQYTAYLRKIGRLRNSDYNKI